MEKDTRSSGGMYRGEPPEAYFDATWEKETVESVAAAAVNGILWQPARRRWPRASSSARRTSSARLERRG